MVKRALDVMEQLQDASMVRHLPVNKDIPEKKQDLSAEIKEKPVSKTYDYGDSDREFSMFPEEALFLDELRDLNLNEMTPLQALNYLHELTGRLKK